PVGLRLTAPHALRATSGARRVEHRRHPPDRPGPWRLRIAPLIPVGHAIRYTRKFRRYVEGGSDLRRRRYDQHLDMIAHALADLWPEIGMAHQNPGATIADDVAHLVGLEMPVDRHHRRAEGGGGA